MSTIGLTPIKQRGPKCDCGHPVEDHMLDEDECYTGACRWGNCQCKEYELPSEKQLKKDLEQQEKRRFKKMLRLLQETPSGMMNCLDVKFLTNYIQLGNEKERKTVIRLYEKYITFETLPYTICRHCDHFIDSDITIGSSDDEFLWDHMDDGEQAYDHNAEPSSLRGPYILSEWRNRRPDLFQVYEDGRTGPNSIHHSRKGKIDAGNENAA
jgi:hypothetical protein